MHDAPGAISCCDVRPGSPGASATAPRCRVFGKHWPITQHRNLTHARPAAYVPPARLVLRYHRTNTDGYYTARDEHSSAAKRCRPASGTAWLRPSEHAIHVTEPYSLSENHGCLHCYHINASCLRRRNQGSEFARMALLQPAILHPGPVPCQLLRPGADVRGQGSKQWGAILNLQLVKLRAGITKSTRSRAFTSISFLP